MRRALGTCLAALVALVIPVAGPTAGPTGGSAAAAPAPVAPAAAAATDGTRVLAISVDGLNPAALRRLGRERTPTLHRLLAEGASTRNARTERELTLTLPNHTGMVTGRRVDADHGGHGVTWNTHRPRTTVQRAAGHAVTSVFSVVHQAGGESALFAGKDKLSIFERSWPSAVDRFTFDEDPLALVRAARRDLVGRTRELTFLHLATPDVAGHEHGFMSSAYLAAVERTDRLVGKMVRAVENHADLRRDVVVVVTSDHGGKGRHHYDPTRLADYRVPFLAWGAGIAPADLYELNPDYAEPGRRRTTYAGKQPVRNGDLANLALRLLGLDPVPGSQFGRRHALDVTAS